MLEPAGSFKFFSELSFGLFPVHCLDFPKFEVLFCLSEFFAVPRRALKARVLVRKVRPKSLDNLKLFPAGKLAQLGNAHGVKFMRSVNRSKSISGINPSVFSVHSVVNPLEGHLTPRIGLQARAIPHKLRLFPK